MSGDSAPAPSSIRAWAQRVLDGGALADKLCAPVTAQHSALPDDEPGMPDLRAGAARDGELRISSTSEKLPKLAELTRIDARVACLSRFAHHELMAIELFAWALLAFPQLPTSLRRGFVAAAAEEQTHLRLYLARLAAHGARLGDLPLSGYFWSLMPSVQAAAEPALAFLCAQGLTLEQANLDFTILYRDAFRRADDEATAQVLQQVHDDEIAHVRLAVRWLERLSGRSDVDAYRDHVPFPLSAARAKGRRFEAGARARAGLSSEFIAVVRDARPYAATPAASMSVSMSASKDASTTAMEPNPSGRG